MLGRQLDIHLTTARLWIKNWKVLGYIKKGSRGGQKSRKITEEIGNFLIQYLKEHPMSTLLDMKRYLTNRHQKEVSLSTISNFLRDKNVTMKLVRDVISSRNSETTKQKRFDYASKILEGAVDLHRCIFIDESGFNHGIAVPMEGPQKVLGVSEFSLHHKVKIFHYAWQS